jgi:hypothetical protein
MLLRVNPAAFKMNFCIWRTHSACCLFALWSSLLLLVIPAGFSCDDMTTEANALLNHKCGSSQPTCSCRPGDDGIIYAWCQDPQRMCSTLDKSFCGTQSSIVYYDDLGQVNNHFYFTYDSGVKVTFKKDHSSIFGWGCEASITDAYGAETSCECSYPWCPNSYDSKAQITCGDYESGAFASDCMDNWGVQGGVMLAYSINSGLCEVADDGDGGGSSTSGAVPVHARSLPTSSAGNTTTGSSGNLCKLIAVVAASSVLLLLLFCDDWCH